MKRKVLLIVISSFMIMGVVSAASLWGSYKGNPIIKVNIDGAEIKYKGVPAISYNSQVMIPITTLKELDVKYSYDSKKLTVNIKHPPKPVDEEAVRHAPISWLQLYYTISNDYRNMNEMAISSGSRLYIIGHIFDYTLDGKSSSEIKTAIETAKSDKQFYQDNLKPLIERVNNTISWGEENALDLSNMKESLESLQKSQEYFDKALSSAESYYNLSRNKNYADDYIYYIDNATKERSNALKLISSGLEEYFQLIQNFK